MWAEHRALLEAGTTPVTTAPVVSQVIRSAQQVQLRRLLRGCRQVPFLPQDSHEVGRLLGRAGTSDVVDAHLVVIATRAGVSVRTGDKSDIGHLCSYLPNARRVLPVSGP